MKPNKSEVQRFWLEDLGHFIEEHQVREKRKRAQEV